MKIVEVLFTLESGGAERFVVDLSNELSSTCDVVLLTLKDDTKNSETRNFYKFDLAENVEYRNLGLPDSFSVGTWFKIYNEIRKLNPDVVHLNAKTAFQFCALAVFLLSGKIHFYETIHNDLHNGYTTFANKLMFNTVGRWKRIKYIALSQTNYEDMKKEYPYCDISCIVNGRARIVPTTLFDKVKREIAKYRTDDNTKVFLHVARCNIQKNQSLLIHAFNEAIAKGVNVQLLIVGAGFDTQEGEKLKNIAEKNIHFLGTRKNISDYMLNVDAFCLSSIYEGMPITLLEASLAGIPCVSTPVCGSVDVIKNGLNGYLCKDFSIKEYVTTIELTVRNYAALKFNAEKMMENSPYTIKECAKKYLDLFQIKC